MEIVIQREPLGLLMMFFVDGLGLLMVQNDVATYKI